MTRLHITLNGYGIADISITLHCYHIDTPIDNDCPSAALQAVKQDISQFFSTVQVDMKVSTLNKEARRRYKFTTLTQNLLSFLVLAKNRYTIKLDRTSINVTKGGKKLVDCYREQNTIFWRLKLE